MSRILWLGDAAHTGFGTVTQDLGRRLLALGEDVRFISSNTTAEPIPEPIGSRTWDAAKGVDVAAMLTTGFRDGWKPDACVILSDFFAARGYILGTAPVLTQAFASLPTFHYVPVEGVDLPPAWMETWQVVLPVAMSKFGATQIEKIAGYRPPMIYHGVDTDDFYPVSIQNPGYWHGRPIVSKEAAKAAISYPQDRVMVLRTDRHMPRKQQNRLIRIMSRVFDQTDNVDLILHCRAQDQGGDLTDTVSKLPEEHRARIKFTNAHDTWKGLERPELNVLLNAADIYATNSPEGFGLTPAEALAAGVPVVAMDYSTLPEIVGPGGVLAPVANLIDNEYDHSWAAVDEEAFAEQIIRLAGKPRLRREMGKLGAAHVRKTFSWDRAAQQFAALAAVAAERSEAA